MLYNQSQTENTTENSYYIDWNNACATCEGLIEESNLSNSCYICGGFATKYTTTTHGFFDIISVILMASIGIATIIALARKKR